MLKVLCALALVVSMTSGCTAVALVDAAASTAVGVGKIAAKGVTATAGALIPDGDDDEKKRKK